MNSMPDTEMKMPLKGLAIGDGLCDPLHQMDYGDFLYQVGLLDESDKNEVDKHADLAKISMELEQWHQATTVSINYFLGCSFLCWSFKIEKAISITLTINYYYLYYD